MHKRCTGQRSKNICQADKHHVLEPKMTDRQDFDLELFILIRGWRNWKVIVKINWRTIQNCSSVYMFVPQLPLQTELPFLATSVCCNHIRVGCRMASPTFWSLRLLTRRGSWLFRNLADCRSVPHLFNESDTKGVIRRFKMENRFCGALHVETQTGYI